MIFYGGTPELLGWMLVSGLGAVVLPAICLRLGRTRPSALFRAVSIPLAVLGLGWFVVSGGWLLALTFLGPLGIPGLILAVLVGVWPVVFTFSRAAAPPPEGQRAASIVYLGTAVVVVLATLGFGWIYIGMSAA
jgi:hypothetical protein